MTNASGRQSSLDCSSALYHAAGLWSPAADCRQADSSTLSDRTVLQRYLVVWLVLLSGIAYAWPRLVAHVSALEPARQAADDVPLDEGAAGQRSSAIAPTSDHLVESTSAAGLDPFLWWTRPVQIAAAGPWNTSRLWYLIAATMFSIGWLLPRDEVRQVLTRWPTVLGGVALQYTAMPLLAVGAAQLVGLEGADWVGVVLVGCVPGAMASNVLTLVARGNVSYSLSLTTTATLVSPLVVPTALWLALGQRVDFPVAQTSVELAGFVVLPVVAGHLVGRSLPALAWTAARLGPLVANLAILLVIAVVVASNRERLTQFAPLTLAALVAINVLGYTAGATGGRLLRLPAAMRRALTLEIGMQNAALGSTLALSLFPDEPATAIAPAIYTFGCMFTGTLLARWWAEQTAGLLPAGNDLA